MKSVVSWIVETGLICTMNNTNTIPLLPAKRLPGNTYATRGTHAGEDWQIFTVMPRVLGNFRYLVVLIDLVF